jgi:hypothetical protein
MARRALLDVLLLLLLSQYDLHGAAGFKRGRERS